MAEEKKPKVEIEEDEDDEEFLKLKKQQESKEANLSKYQKIVIEDHLEEIVDGEANKGKKCIYCGEENDKYATRCKKCKQRLF